MPQGKIKRLFMERGFGFIESTGGDDVFFHHSTVANRAFDDLIVGQEVRFSLATVAKKGARAKEVFPLTEVRSRAA